jgi:hypothetical protein
LELQAILSVERPEFWKGVVDQGLTPDVLGWEMSKAEVVLMEKELRNALYVLEDEPSRCPSLYDMFLFP